MSGFATTIPMVLFTYGARQVTLTTLGILQYIAISTLQFLLGAFVYGEGFRQDQMVGFGLIWVALALYSVEGIVTAAPAVGYGSGVTRGVAQSRCGGASSDAERPQRWRLRPHLRMHLPPGGIVIE